MKNVIHLLGCTFFCIIFLSSIVQAQNSLTHNTGTLEVTTIENGYIGNDHSGNYGGVIFNGNQNAMPGSAGAGIIFGRNGEGHGNYGSLFEEFYNDIPIAGFFPHTFFNQYAYYTIALTGDPDSKTFVESFSNTGHDFVFLRASLSDNTTNIDDIYPVIFADWDVGNYNLNRGGYDTTRNLFYMYENGGAGDASYYSIMGIAIDGVPMAPNTMRGTITDSVAWDYWALYDLMTSTVFDTITTDGDYRMYTCFGPFSFPAGSTLVVDVAIVAGTSLADLQANADEAKSYWQVVPVETEMNNHFTFELNQNYPNPSNPTTTIKFQIPELSFVTIKVFDVLGSEITTLVNEEKAIGSYEVEFDASRLSSGIYFYQLKSGDFVETKKMVLLR
ncbi:MAG: T9SS type A sorting domain-containing protein [Ignavibacteriaceae bacterium]|nr:T9SS type A sorting domain-containing protein [Ignavibacteriaceae bacterium]